MMVGIQQLESRFRSCGKSYRVRGKVNATVTVGPSGRVASLTTGQDAGFDQCLMSEARNVTFAPTRIGGQAIIPLDMGWFL
jgi:hypothetical protein